MTAVADRPAPEAVPGELVIPELDALGVPHEPMTDAAPTKARRKRSGTSGAERARRAKAAGGDSAPAKPRAARTRTAAPKIGAGMAQLYTMVGIGVGMVPSGPAVAGPGRAAGASITGTVGTALVANSAAIGAAWEQAAKDDPRVRDALEKLLAVSTFGQIIAAHMPVVMAGMVAAGAVPAAVIGYTEPEGA